MKKTLLALAVTAAFANAASAQSSVTLYGRVEANVTYSDRGSELLGNSRTSLNDGGANSGIGGSRWGLRGTEDLGGGLKAYFLVESGFNSDTGGQENGNTGAAANPLKLFSRLAYLGIGGGWGDVRLGRQETISRQINAIGDVSVLGELKIDETVIQGSADNTSLSNGRVLFQTFGQRIDNALTYISPSFSGFKGQLLVAAGEKAAPDYYGVQFSYSAGPLNVALGYEELAKFGVFDKAFNKTVSLGANYNFGPATVHVGFKDTQDVGSAAGAAVGTVEDQQAYTVGVLVPVGNWQFRASYINADYDLSTGSEDIQKYGVSARYALSKRTAAYAAYTTRSGSSNGTAPALQLYNDEFFAQKSEFAVGVAHTF